MSLYLYSRLFTLLIQVGYLGFYVSPTLILSYTHSGIDHISVYTPTGVSANYLFRYSTHEAAGHGQMRFLGRGTLHHILDWGIRHVGLNGICKCKIMGVNRGEVPYTTFNYKSAPPPMRSQDVAVHR